MASMSTLVAGLSREQQLAELVDEVTYVHGQIDLWQNGCEALLRYVVALERQVLGPAYGAAVYALRNFHDVADARARGEASVQSILQQQQGVDGGGGATASELAQLFRRLHTPLDPTVASARRLVRSGEAILQQGVDKAFLALLAHLEQLPVLQATVADAMAALAGSGDGRTQGVEEDAALRRENEELRARLEQQQQQQQHPSAAVGTSSDRTPDGQRMRIAENRLRQAEADRDAAVRAYEALQSASKRTSAGGGENEQLAQRVRVLETELVQLRAANEKLRSAAAATTGASFYGVTAASASGAADASTSIFGTNPRISSSSALTNNNATTTTTVAGKLRAFEMTIAALNTELAQQEQKYTAAEARHQVEKQEWQQRQSEDRRRFEDASARYDETLGTMMVDLEECMAALQRTRQENDDLRVRLAATKSSSSSRGATHQSKKETARGALP